MRPFPREDFYNMDYEDGGFGMDPVEQNQGLSNFIAPPQPVQQAAQEPAPQPTPQPAAQPAAPQPTPQPDPVAQLLQQPAEQKPDYISALSKQILGQNLTGKWSGEGYGSAEKNAADMAKILSGIGVNDIKDFGKIPQYATQQTYQGQPVGTDENGNPYITVPGGGTDDYGNQEMVRQNIDDPSQIKTEQIQTGTAYGNKKTGQIVPNTYSERQTGNFWGGTFEGKGNTGYGVQFDEQGNPYFYTQGASSSDIGKIAPLLAIASFVPGLQPFAAGLNALIAAKSGNALGAIAGMAGLGGFSDVANAANFANAVQNKDILGMIGSGAGLSGVGDIGGINIKDITKGIGTAKALQSGDPLALMRAASGYMGGSGDGPNSDDFIQGYFQPGGEGYIPPSGGGDENVFDPTYGGTMPTGDEYTGSFDDYLGNPTGDEYTGSFDDYLGNPNEDYTGSFDDYLGNPTGDEELPMPSVDDDFVPTDDIEEPDTGEPTSKSGGSKGGTKGGTAPTGKAAVAKALTGGKSAASTAAAAAAAAAAQQQAQQLAQYQSQQNALMQMAGSNNDVAHIKSYKELFGEDLFGNGYVPPSARDAGDGSGYVPEPSAQGEDQMEEFFKGGDVSDINTLLQILRG